MFSLLLRPFEQTLLSSSEKKSALSLSRHSQARATLQIRALESMPGTSCVYPTSNTFTLPFILEEMKPKLHDTEVFSDRANKSQRSGSAQGRSKVVPQQIWHVCLPQLSSPSQWHAASGSFAESQVIHTLQSHLELHSYYLQVKKL